MTMIGERLRMARNAAGLTQQVAAVRAGMQTETLARYERGQRSPTVAVLARIANVYGVSVHALLEDAA